MTASAAKSTILLVHGAWHGAWCWEDAFAPHLRKLGFAVETLDLPGHGQPGKARLPWYSISDYVTAIETRLKQIGSPSIVVGHSMGGYAVQKLMERRPANLAGSILMAAATQRGVLGVVAHLLATRPVDFLVANLKLDLYHLTRSPAMVRPLFHTDELPEPSLKKHWSRLNNESYRAFLDMMLLAPTHPDKVDPELPRLVIGGENDAIFPPNIVAKTAENYGVEAIIYDGMPHNMMQDKRWPDVANDIADWVSAIN